MAPRSSSTRSTPGIPPRPALAKLGSRAPGSRCLPMIRTASSNVLSLLEQPPDPEPRIIACYVVGPCLQEAVIGRFALRWRCHRTLALDVPSHAGAIVAIRVAELRVEVALFA